MEQLAKVDQLFVNQKLEPLEIITSFESKNKYIVKNSAGQQIYYAEEQSGCLSRQFWGPLRPFKLTIMDNSRRTVIDLRHPLGCNPCLFPCCPHRIYVSAPTPIGTIVERCSIFRPAFDIQDAGGETVFHIKGPICVCGRAEFKLMSADGKRQIGKIMKKWGGLLREMFTDADHFGVSFPIELDVRMKAVLLAACFLIDFRFFEK